MRDERERFKKELRDPGLAGFKINGSYSHLFQGSPFEKGLQIKDQIPSRLLVFC